MGRPIWACFLGLTCFLVIAPTAIVAVIGEARFLKKLKNPDLYDKITRPVYNSSTTVHVKMGLALMNIYEVNEASGYMITYAWVRYLWRDLFLRWDPEDYDRVDHLRIPPELIWRPDIVLYNGVSSETTLIQNNDAMTVVSSDGTVLYIPQVTLKSSCTFDITNFPFDEQTCTLKFGSWTYDGFKVDLDFYDDLDEIDVTDYIANNEWELVGHPAKKNVKYYPCCNEPYLDMEFTVRIKRRPNFYTQVFIVPGVVLSLLTPTMFALPATGAPRYVLGTGLLITLAVTLSGLDDLLPRVSSTPIIGRWYAALEALVVIALLLSVIVTNMANRATHGKAPPHHIKKIFVDVLGRALLVERANAKSLSVEGGTGGQSRYWELAARTLDRLFFLIYCAAIIILACICTMV